MAETQGDIYVRKDVFDARISRLEELQLKTASELREARSELRSLNAKFNSIGLISSGAILGFWIVLAILASTIILATASLAIRKIFQPSVTLEDVERIVNAAIANHLSGGKAE